MPQRIEPKDALNAAYRKQKPAKSELEQFTCNLNQLLEKVRHSEAEKESEENFKNLLSGFLKDTYYQDRFQINTFGRTDLVIHNDKTAKSTVGVLLEVKKPSNRAEMITPDNLNAKAFHELLLYYFGQKDKNNNDLKYCVITNVYEWYIFDAAEFYREFEQDKALKKEYFAWRDKQKEGATTDYFYKNIAAAAVAKKQENLRYTYFDLRTYEPLLSSEAGQTSRKLLWLYKLLSPEHLLKQSFANDSNSLDRKFYNELLHIIGLTEVKEKGKKLIERKKAGERDQGSLLENALSILKAEGRLRRVPNPEQYGDTDEERLFGVALELSITWLNRILFLKLLEAQLITYHQNREYAFLNQTRVPSFDELNSLFFKVLAKPTAERTDNIKETFGQIPYLNSSLFEPTELEYDTLVISNLEDRFTLPVYRQTVLKDGQGKRLSDTNLSTLEYLFRFLDAYDFSSEGSEEVQREDKTLINASVLGLIFEKINGYRDGSFFTPGFITMYMSREVIRRAVTQKFNEAFNLELNSFEEVKNFSNRNFAADFIRQANELIDGLTICDPAVGSGHFLVSALNELLAIKSELGILADRDYGTLPVRVAVVNDELIVTERNGDFFTYRPGVTDSQRIQETLFHEKEKLIERCLFGVDINSNSVKICRLRLWIELLKNAYYTEASKYTELETLPNIDINIKTGNSLLYCFDLQEDLSEVFKKQNSGLRVYKDTVKAYKHTRSREEKEKFLAFIRKLKEEIKTEVSKRDPRRKKIADLRGQLALLDNNFDLFGKPIQDPELVKVEKKRITMLIEQREREIEEIENNKLYQNAFEWRFEFPEVLDERGNFVGFDIVIGNPPYIRQEEIKDQKPYLQQQYDTYAGTADLLVYFVELSMRILKDGGYFTYIIANKFMRANFGSNLRRWLQQYQFEEIIDFGDLPVFEEATTYPCILSLHKAPPTTIFSGAVVDTLDFDSLPTHLNSIRFDSQQSQLSNKGWAISDERVQRLLTKIKSKGVPLSEYVNGKVYYGIKTGLNEAFVIDEATREQLIAEDPKSEEVIKPFLAGRDVKRYAHLATDKYLILFEKGWTRKKLGKLPEEAAFAKLSERYSAVAEHLRPFATKAKKRQDQGDYWWELRACDYYAEFEKPKIIYPNICKQPEFAFDDEGIYTNQKCFIISLDDKFLLGYLNSSLNYFLFQNILPKLRGDFFEPSYVFFRNFPVPKADKTRKATIVSAVEKVLARESDTEKLAAEINQLVYELYGLTEEEIGLIEL